MKRFHFHCIKRCAEKADPVFAGAVTRAIYSWRYSGISAIHLGGGLTVFILLSYDIADSPERLRKVAKICENYGVRVQKSVFELDISMANFVQLKAELSRLVDRNADTIRFYRLGKNYKNQIEVIGKREDIELSQDNSIIL